jgi:hypothetical protein
MGMAIGIAEWVVVIIGICWWRSARRQRQQHPGPTQPRQPAPTRRSVSEGTPSAGAVEGWMIGHAVAHGHSGFPGDPLPHGHLGSPANLAFWGSLIDDDDEDDEGSGDW